LRGLKPATADVLIGSCERLPIVDDITGRRQWQWIGQIFVKLVAGSHDSNGSDGRLEMDFACLLVAGNIY
ncbi:hypothetical protein Q6247_26065, partial [Klebsiella pneumoniae]